MTSKNLSVAAFLQFLTFSFFALSLTAMNASGSSAAPTAKKERPVVKLKGQPLDKKDAGKKILVIPDFQEVVKKNQLDKAKLNSKVKLSTTCVTTEGKTAWSPSPEYNDCMKAKQEKELKGQADHP